VSTSAVSARRRQQRARSTPADKQREARLVVRWQRFGDEGARNRLIERYMPLARSLASRFGGAREGSDDREQVASIGLLKAIDGFDVERGFAFSSFAVPTILGELRRHARDFGWPVYVPRRMRDRAVQVRRVSRRLEVELGRSPTSHELAEATDLTVEEVDDALEASASARIASLDVPAGGEEENPADRWMGADDGGYELVEYRDAVARRLRGCSDRERLLLRLRLVDDMSQVEIGREIGVSQMQVSRLLRQLLDEPSE
jgi:RNA polymerase sigma-B factor